LWPLSRDDTPKQFLKLFDYKSLFQLTLDRALKLVPASRIFISTSQKYIPQVKKESKKISDENIIGEPMRRDTALAMGLGALYIQKRDPDAIIVNLASDHLIKPISIFIKNMLEAARFAFESDQVVTIGIRPKFPHTGMGHIKFSGNKGLKFVEKPSLPLAKQYTSSGDYYWNANLYVWKAKVFLDLLKKHSPKTYSMFPKILNSMGTDKEREILQLTFQMAPVISVDYAVSEKLQKFICLPAGFSWTDVGDWNEVWKNLPKDSLGNVISGPKGKGKYIGLDSSNNLLFLDKQLIATAGVKDMLIIDTLESLLICPKNDAQAVKKIVEILKEQDLTKYL